MASTAATPLLLPILLLLRPGVRLRVLLDYYYNVYVATGSMKYPYFIVVGSFVPLQDHLVRFSIVPHVFRALLPRRFKASRFLESMLGVRLLVLGMWGPPITLKFVACGPW